LDRLFTLRSKAAQAPANAKHVERRKIIQQKSSGDTVYGPLLPACAASVERTGVRHFSGKEQLWLILLHHSLPQPSRVTPPVVLCSICCATRLILSIPVT